MVAAWGSDSDDDEVDKTALMDLGDSDLEEEDDASKISVQARCANTWWIITLVFLVAKYSFGWGKLKWEVNCYQFKYLVDYHFVVPSGKIVTLVGESGRENSTVISLLERFYDPEAGEVRIDGVNLKKYQLKWLRQQIGLVSQEPILFANTIKENISYGKENATAEKINTAIEIANAANFIKLRDSSLNLDCTSFFGVALGAIIPVKRVVSA
ncbi:hypothetical protein T459_05273 [Capsicum annuum]|uniref:ABC transporter domain-containing protein n=1 Tax=Capsicum annuum TaxID=4072 RepID=A0A2G3A7J3_CAPAN|nr:hypothetical protein T459_05273 [Capsicum annuum]